MGSSARVYGLGIVLVAACSPSSAHDSPDLGAGVDWALTFAAAPAGTLAPALLGQYDPSGALYHYDRQAPLPALMRAAGFGEWRVGVGRWEFATQLLPTLTDGTSCAAAIPIPQMAAPAGTTDLDLIAARDWFTFTDGTPVTTSMTADDARYQLAYVRSVIDVATAMGATPYVDIDHMPRALAANEAPLRSDAEWPGNCGVSWTNKVSNVRPAAASVFAAAVVGLVRRVVEGSGGEPRRPVRYWEFWNEPDLGYAWNPHLGDFPSWLQTALTTLTALDDYRRQTTNADGRSIRIGPATMDLALHYATVLALAATAGIEHAHHAIFWDFFPVPGSNLAVVHHDFSPAPAFYAFALVHELIGDGATRLAAGGFADGKLDGGMGAVLAGRDAAGVVRVLLVNRSATARTATVGAMPTAVTAFDDPAQPPRTVSPSEIVAVPARSLVLVER